MSFIETLRDEKDFARNAVAVVRRGTQLEDKCRDSGLAAISVGAGKWDRLLFEVSCRSRFRRGQTCFTLFGPAMITSRGYLLNIVGCAYSNLFYPEINFWRALPKGARQIALAKDELRRHFSCSADYWVFETQVLKQRATELCNFPEGRVSVVPMSVSRLVSTAKVDDIRALEFERILPNAFRFLFLNGPNPNKRIHLLPRIATELRKKSSRDFVFVTTMDAAANYTRQVVARANAMGCDQVVNIGPVRAADVAALISRVDAMCTFSRLESFSNNFTEAWAMKRPLLAARTDWAEAACGRAAMYVDPEDASETAGRMASLMETASLRDDLVWLGERRLADYPTPDEKTHLYIGAIKNAERLGPCARSARRAIKWPKIATC